MAWNPFGVMLELSANAVSVTRTSLTSYNVTIKASWETYYDGAQTNFGMRASCGGQSVTLNPFGTKASSGSGTLTVVGSISGGASATKSMQVQFTNFNSDTGQSKQQAVTVSFTVPAWPSYTIRYNANGGTGAPSSQLKWKDQAIKLSSVKPTRTGYTFQGWATSASGSVAYAAGASYTANGNVTLYAVWKLNTYTISFDANGGSGAPASQTKTYGTTLVLSSTVPTRTNYAFKGWGIAANATTVAYAAGASYTANAAITLYAVWELSYNKPRITNFSVQRCDSAGTVKNDGTYALLKFDWATDQTATTITAAWTDADGTICTWHGNASGTSGSVNAVIGDGNFAVTSSYSITVTVADAQDASQFLAYSSKDKRTLNSLGFTIHGKPNGDGVAFGKMAELGKDDSFGGYGVAEFVFDGKFNSPVYGKALGMDRLPAIPSYADFNDYLDPGCYAVQSNAIAETIANIPIARAGRLEVWSSTGEGVRAEQWSYLRQRFIPYNSSNAVWERELTRGEDNVWHYYGWWRSSLTPAASEKVYSKAAMTIALSTTTTLGVVNTYTKIPLDKIVLSTSDRLSMQDGSIRIGSNIQYVKVSGQALVKCGSTAGNRHARIQKISGGTTTSIAWDCVYGAANGNTEFPFSPIIVPVSEGDLLFIVYYTGDATDNNASGSTANGWQTYLTVEEL